MIFHFLIKNNFMDQLAYQNSRYINKGNARLFAKTGLWTQKEKHKYVLFLLYHQCSLEMVKDVSDSKMKGVYQAMSRWIGSRKVNQCRLYHIKMASYYQSIGTIIQQLTDTLPSCIQQTEELELNIERKVEEVEFDKDDVLKVEFYSQKSASQQDELKMAVDSGSQSQGRVVEVKKKRKTSIIIHYEQKEINFPKKEIMQKKEQDLLRTDQTLPDFPSAPSNRSRISLNFPEHQPSIESATVCSPSSTNEQWLNCHNLYLSWLSKVSQLQRVFNNRPESHF